MIQFSLADVASFAIAAARAEAASAKDVSWLQQCFDVWAVQGPAAAETHAIAFQPDESNPTRRFLEGLFLYGKKRPEEALPFFELLEKQFCWQGLAAHFCGRVFGSRGLPANNGRAYQAFRRTQAVYPDWTDNLLCLGEYAYRIGAIEESLIALRRGLVLRPERQEAHELLIKVLGWAGRYDEIMDHLQAYPQLKPLFADDLGRVTSEPSRSKIIVARYPDQKDLNETFLATVKKTILAELQDVSPFITPQTRFFTLGSCFARNLSRALRQAGYESQNLNIVENINTTYANRRIMEWVTGALPDELDQSVQALMGRTTKENLIDHADSTSQRIIFRKAKRPEKPLLVT